MKHLMLYGLLLLSSALLAQEGKRNFFDYVYWEAQVGGSLSAHPEYSIKSNLASSLSMGARFGQGRSLGLVWSYFAKSVSQGYGGYDYARHNLGLRYRLEASERIAFYFGGGLIGRLSTTRIGYEVLQPTADCYSIGYGEVGLRLGGGPAYLGLSFVKSRKTRAYYEVYTLANPDELTTGIKMIPGISMLTLDFVLLFQRER